MMTLKQCEIVIDSSNPFLFEHYNNISDDDLIEVRKRMLKEKNIAQSLKKDPKYINEVIVLIDAIMTRRAIRNNTSDKEGYSIG